MIIEKGIPIPDEAMRPKPRRGRRPKYRWLEMEVNDSFWTETPYHSMRMTAQGFGQRNDMEFFCLPEGDGTRVWRKK